MKKRIVISIILLALLTTITSQQKITVSKFNLKKIIVENNFLIKEKDIKNSLLPIYDRNLVFLDYSEIEKVLMQNSFIESFKIKKKYPNTLKIKIFEKKPIAILQNKKKKYYLSERIDLIEFENLKNYQDLPYIFGNKENFKIIYDDLKKINFPLNLVKKFIFFDSNRWDIETIDKKIVKLPNKNYTQSLENFLKIKDKKRFKNYKVFDYRLEKQLILK